MRTTKIMTLSLPPEMFEEVEDIIKEEKRTRSELFREALRRYINERHWLMIRRWGMKSSRETGILSEEDVDRVIHKYRKTGK